MQDIHGYIFFEHMKSGRSRSLKKIGRGESTLLLARGFILRKHKRTIKFGNLEFIFAIKGSKLAIVV